MPRADLQLAHRLLCASNLAYGIESNSHGEDSFAITPPILPSKGIIDALVDAVGFEPGSVRACQASGRVGIDAFVYGETAELAILAFRGTLPMRLAVESDRTNQIAADWFNSTRARLVAGTEFGLPGYVHRGFGVSLQALWSAAGGLAELLPAVRYAASRGRRLMVTGHSKGGALAQLAALRLASTGVPDLTPAEIHAFAAPRTGNQTFAHAFDHAFPGRAWRFEYRDDIVPHLPSCKSLWFAVRSALRGVNAALTQQPGGKFGCYQSAGYLQFIDWDGELRNGETASLRQERSERLIRALARSLPEVSRSHLPMRGFGYMDFLERNT